MGLPPRNAICFVCGEMVLYVGGSRMTYSSFKGMGDDPTWVNGHFDDDCKCINIDHRFVDDILPHREYAEGNAYSQRWEEAKEISMKIKENVRIEKINKILE